MRFQIKLTNGTESFVTPQEICENYATEVCRNYGWDYRSAAWRDLSRSEDAAPAFLLDQVRKMFPNATITAVA
jgi:hypothetical protein